MTAVTPAARPASPSAAAGPPPGLSPGLPPPAPVSGLPPDAAAVPAPPPEPVLEAPPEPYRRRSERSETVRLLLARLGEQPDFPSLGAALRLVDRVARQDSSRVQRLAEAIARDIGAACRVLRLVNTVYYRTAGAGKITSIMRAINVIGFATVADMTRLQRPVEELEFHHGQQLRLEMLRAMLAGVLARILQPEVRFEQEAQLAAVFQHLGMLMLALHLPEQARTLRLDTRALEGGEWLRVLAEERHSLQQLGQGLNDLSHDIARQWGWAPALRYALQWLPHGPGCATTPAEQLRLVATLGSDLAPLLLTSTPEDWPAACAALAALRPEQTLGTAELLLEALGQAQLELPELVRRLDLVAGDHWAVEPESADPEMYEARGGAAGAGPDAASAADATSAADSQAAAAAAAPAEPAVAAGADPAASTAATEPPREGREAAPPQAADDAGAGADADGGGDDATRAARATDFDPGDPVDAAAREAEQIEQALAVLGQGLQDVTQALLAGEALPLLLRRILDVLWRGFDGRLAVLCLREPAYLRLRPAFAFGLDDELPPDSFRIELRDEALDLYASVCRSGIEQLVPDTNHPDLREQLPDWHRHRLEHGAFLLVPLQLRERPVGLIYLDHARPYGLAVQERTLPLVRALRNLMLLALQSSRRAPTAPAPAPHHPHVPWASTSY